MNFKELRIKRKVNQVTLANAIGTSQARISRLDNGALPNVEEVIKLAKALKVSEKRIINIYRKED